MRHARTVYETSLTYEAGVLVYRTPYSEGLVAALKAEIPVAGRTFDRNRKAWLVAPEHASTLVKLTDQYLGENIGIPAMPALAAKPETRVLDVRYVGMTKDRGDGQRSAFGHCGGEWSVIFPESVLRAWFGVDMRPEEAPTLYGVLGLKAITAGSEIKKAYRRLSLQWHPDRCKEPDAKDQFIKIQRAYELLSNPATRARYDAGLALEALTKRNPRGMLDDWNASFGNGAQAPQPWNKTADGYRSPLRCGMILATGQEKLGRFIIEQINAWEDITNARGQTLSTSWPAGATEFVEAWI